jgi:hypothetical protein
LSDATLLTLRDAIGMEALSALEVGMRALSEPATGDDRLRTPATGTPATLFDAAAPGPTESPPHENSETVRVTARKNLMDGETPLT